MRISDWSSDVCSSDLEATKRGVEPATVGQADWLESRREELVDRMHTRRERDVGVGYGSRRGYGGRRRYPRAWRPGAFTFTSSTAPSRRAQRRDLPPCHPARTTQNPTPHPPHSRPQ